MKLNCKIFRSSFNPASIPFDKKLFNMIVNDLQLNGKTNKPSKIWMKTKCGINDKYSAKDMMLSWEGFGKNKIDEKAMFWWYEDLHNIDHLHVLDYYFPDGKLTDTNSEFSRISDFGVLWDLLITTSQLIAQKNNFPTIVEVGGGYGRFAESIYNAYNGNIKYLLIDVVPTSLMCAYSYLNEVLPDAKIGFYYNGDEYDLEKYNIYIMPIWHLSNVRDVFDLAINVQSMQEMEKGHIEFYFNLFNKLLKNEKGVVYLCNRRDHYYKDEWPIPSNWQCLMKTDSPRSWNRDFPIELYRVTNDNYLCSNKIVDAFYQNNWQLKKERKIIEARALGITVY